MKKKLLYGGTGLLGALLSIVFIAPHVIDWNDYKPDLVTLIEEKTGRSVHVAGDIKITFLPVPKIHVEDVALGNVPQAREKTMVAFKLLSAQLALSPLLSGMIEITGLQVEEPVLHLQNFPDGSNNWTFTPQGTADRAASPVHDDVSGESDPGIPLALSDIRVRGGRVFYHDPAGQVLVLEDVDLDMAVPSLYGPFSGEATGRIHSVPLALDFDVEQVTLDQPAIDITLRLPDADGQARLRGSFDFSGGKTHPDADRMPPVKFSGNTEVTGSSLSTALTAVMTAVDPDFSSPSVVTDIMAHPYQVTGDLVVDGNNLSVNDMAIRLADLKAGGGMNALLGEQVEVDLALVFGHLDLDPLLEMIARSAGQADDSDQKPAGNHGNDKDQGTDSGDGVLIRAHLVSPAVLYRGKPIRDVAADMIFSGRSLHLKGFQAHSPGGGQIDLSGTFDGSATPAALEADVVFRSDNLRPDLQWLGMDIDGIPGDRLRHFSAQMQLKGDLENLEFTDIDFHIDQSKGRAAAVVALRERPGLGLSFTIDDLDIDAYRPQKSRAQKSQDGSKSAGRGGGRLALSKNWLDVGLDANLRGRIGSMRLGGILARELSLELSLDRDVLTLKEISLADLAGLKTMMRGRIDGSGPLPKLDLSLTASGADIGASVKRLGGTTPPLIERLGAVKVKADLAGGLNEVRYQGEIGAAGGGLMLEGTLRSLLISPQIEAGIKADFPSFTPIAGLFSPGYRPAGSDPGPLSLTGQLAGDFDQLNFSAIVARLGAITLRGDGDFSFMGSQPHVRATITTDEVILDPFFPAASQSGQQGSYGAPSRTGTGGAGKTVPPWYHRLFYGGHPSRTGDARKTGPPWSRTPFDLSALRDLRLDVVFSGQSLRYGPYHLVAPEMTITSDGNRLSLAPVSGSLFGGGIGLEAVLTMDPVPEIQTMLSWQGADIGAALKSFDTIEAVHGALDLTLDLSGKGDNPAAMISSLKGNSRAMIREPVLRGVDLAATGQRLNDSGVSVILDILTAASADEHTSFETIEGDFVIRDGVITSQPIPVISDAGTGNVEAVIDLPRYLLDAHSRFSLAALVDAPPLAVRLEGSLESPDYTFVTRDLEKYLIKRRVGSVTDQLLPGFQSEPAREGDPGQESPLRRLSAPEQEGQSNQPDPPPPDQTPLPDVEEGLRSILDQILP